MVRQIIYLLMFCGVGAFVPRSVNTKSPVVHLPSEMEGSSPFLGPIGPSNTSLSMGNKKEETTESAGFFENFKDKPIMFVVFPFLVLFGVDILLNIVVLVKRTFDYFVLGQAPSSEPWW